VVVVLVVVVLVLVPELRTQSKNLLPKSQIYSTQETQGRSPVLWRKLPGSVRVLNADSELRCGLTSPFATVCLCSPGFVVLAWASTMLACPF